MAEETKPPDRTARYVRAIAEQTGTTEEQVRYIISMVGFDHASILREARLLSKDKR